MDKLINTNEIEPTKKIKHLVISGGIVYGYSFYGCLRQLSKLGMWNIEDIETTHSTSVGTIFSTIIALKHEWDTIDAYIVDRPWHTVFKIDIISIMNCYSTRGILPLDIIERIFLPLFGAKDISVNITLIEFFEITGIEMHYYTTSMTNFETVDLSYLTHPDWKVTDAIYVSCSMPIFFIPFIKNNVWYTDGGFISNYPIDFCLKSLKTSDEDEILGIKIDFPEIELHNDTTLFEYIACILLKFSTKMTNHGKTIRNEISITPLEDVSSYDIYALVNSPEKRRHLIDHGINIANSFIVSRTSCKSIDPSDIIASVASDISDTVVSE